MARGMSRPFPLLAGAGLKGSLLHPIKLKQNRIQGQLRLRLARGNGGRLASPPSAPGRPGRSPALQPCGREVPGRLRKQHGKRTLLKSPSRVLGRV